MVEEWAWKAEAAQEMLGQCQLVLKISLWLISKASG